MSKNAVVNVIVLLAAVGAVGAAFWVRSNRAAPAEAESTSTSAPAPAEADAGRDATISSAPEDAAPVDTSATPTESDVVAQPESPTSQPAIAEKLPRLLDLGADKCKACKRLAPILDELREEYAGRLDVDFIDVWKDAEAARPYGIRLIPTQILFDGAGNELWRHEGFISKEELKALFRQKVGVE